MDSRLDFLGKAVARATALVVVHVPDSRVGLRSPEHELAARGVRWVNDPAHDLALARELTAARARRARLVPATAPFVPATEAGPAAA